MNNARVGKIARLPKVVRETLGDRLEAGEKASVLLKWLNGLECVQEILRDYFGCRLITEQNLSEWRQGGHQDWLRSERALVLAGRLTEQGKDLDWAAGGRPLSDRLAPRVVVEMVRLVDILVEEEADPQKRWAQLCQVNRELACLRREDHRAIQLEINQQRWDFQLARMTNKRYQKPDPRKEDLRRSPAGSEFAVGVREAEIEEMHATNPPEYNVPFVPVLEEEEGKFKDQNSQSKAGSNIKDQEGAEESSKFQAPTSREIASAQPQVGGAERAASLELSEGIQVNPSKSNLSEISMSPGKTSGGNDERAGDAGNEGTKGTDGTEGNGVLPPGRVQSNPTKSNSSEEEEEGKFKDQNSQSKAGSNNKDQEGAEESSKFQAPTSRDIPSAKLHEGGAESAAGLGLSEAGQENPTKSEFSKAA